MSTHTNSYSQLKNNADAIPDVQKNEQEISARISYYIPKEKFGDLERMIKDGDIIGITTAIKGLDIQHVGILV